MRPRRRKTRTRRPHERLPHAPRAPGARRRRACRPGARRDRRDDGQRRRRVPAIGAGQADRHGRQGPGARAGARLVRRDGARRSRPGRRPLDGGHAPDLPRRPQAGLLLLARVPDRARCCSTRCPISAWSARRARRCAASASTSTGCAGSSRTPPSATAASGGSPPATWKAWRRCGSPPTATASATTTGSSDRRSKTAADRVARGLAVAGNPWEFERPEVKYAIGFGGTVDTVE